MSAEGVSSERTAWAQRVLGFRVTETGEALAGRFGDLAAAEQRRLDVVRDSVPDAAARVAETMLPKILAAPLGELKEIAGALGRPPDPDLAAADQQLLLAYDVVEALQADWLNKVPIGTFQDVVLADDDVSKRWRESFIGWIDEQERDVGSIALQLAERRYLVPARRAQGGQRAATKLSDGAAAGDYPDARALDAQLQAAMRKCPALEQQFAATLGDKGLGVKIKFSDKTKDAFLDKGSMTIVLPTVGRPPTDLLDGLIFELCNVEIEAQFKALDKQRTQQLKPPRPGANPADPMTMDAYGRQKANIEAQSTLKDCQLLVAAMQSGVEVAYQGQRNLASMLETCRKMQGGAIADFDEILEDKDRLAALLEDNKDELRRFLAQADSEPESRDALLGTMATTPHKRNATAPEDTGQLTSEQMYAYEAMESGLRPGEVNPMLLTEMEKVAIPVTTQRTLRPLMLKLMQLAQVASAALATSAAEADEMSVDSRARNGVLLEIQQKLKAKWPAIDFPTLKFTPDMERVAAARREAAKTGAGSQWTREIDISFERAWAQFDFALTSL